MRILTSFEKFQLSKVLSDDSKAPPTVTLSIMDMIVKNRFAIKIGYFILASYILHLVQCESLSFRAGPLKYHRPSKAIEKYQEYEWIKDDYPIINNWPTISMYDNESCRKPKICVRCQYVLKRYLVYLKNNRRPKNTYKRVLFNNEGWALVTQVYDTRFIYYNNSTKLDRLYLYDAIKLQTDLPSYLDFLCSNWKDEPGQTTLLIAGKAHYLQNSIILITAICSIYMTLCVNSE